MNKDENLYLLLCRVLKMRVIEKSKFALATTVRHCLIVVSSSRCSSLPYAVKMYENSSSMSFIPALPTTLCSPPCLSQGCLLATDMNECRSRFCQQINCLVRRRTVRLKRVELQTLTSGRNCCINTTSL